jgi:AcrR family transcriptional regulator
VRVVDLKVRKRARQSRAIATVDAIVEAAAYILAEGGPARFTTNRVAERAGVNIASLYQYFPNKEALLFQLVRTTWERQMARLTPILSRPGDDHAGKLRDFLREFLLIEAAEVDLRRALRRAAVELSETPEFAELTAGGAALTRRFLGEALADRSPIDLAFHVDFVVTLTTSFAERTTDQGIAGAALIRQADLLTDMLIAHYRIG